MSNFLVLATTNAVEHQETIKTVSPSEFSNKLVSMINVLHQAITPLIMPFAGIGITLSLLFVLLGAMTGSKEIKKIGHGGIGTVFGVMIFYYLYPLILGLFGTAANVIH